MTEPGGGDVPGKWNLNRYTHNPLHLRSLIRKAHLDRGTIF
ncbi:hypothetical protein ACN4EK_15470 [Pantanalinema rosaneae CENA516]